MGCLVPLVSASSRKRHIDTLGLQALLDLLLAGLAQGTLETGFDLVLDRVDQLAHYRPLLLRKRAKPFHQSGQLTLASQESDPDILQGCFARGLCYTAAGPHLSFVQAVPAYWVPLQKKEWECGPIPSCLKYSVRC